MGKKSKKQISRRRSTEIGTAASSAPDSSIGNNAKSTNRASFFQRPPTPNCGWVDELRAAEECAKQAISAGDGIRTSEAWLRVAIAARVLRQWRKCQRSAQKGLAAVTNNADEEGTEGNDAARATRESLAECERAAAKELDFTRSEFDRNPLLEGIFAEIMSRDASVDETYMYSVNPCFTNLNLLQHAAAGGHICAMEKLVALGAALDYPVTDDIYEVEGPEKPILAPPGSTPLILATASLAVHGILENAPWYAPWYEHEVHNTAKKTVEGRLECAVQLVLLGADFNKKLVLDERCNDLDNLMCFLYRQLGLDGKTVKEMAHLSGKMELVDAIKRVESEDDAIERVHCRCGSRLPWKECHANPNIPGQERHFLRLKPSQGGGIIWRHSPLAPCMCKHSKKVSYNCCWFTPSYQNDSNGEIRGNKRFSLCGVAGQELNRYLQKRGEEVNWDPNAPLFDFGNLDDDEVKKRQLQAVRLEGQEGLREMSQRRSCKSRIGEWDIDVYVGCLERIGSIFFWDDIHWALEKSELLKRVEEWNNALEQYCDDMGYAGWHRETLIRKHTASCLAPCANPDCDQWETKVKEFSCCSRCKKVAYCSRDCQLVHWKKHKRICF